MAMTVHCPAAEFLAIPSLFAFIQRGSTGVLVSKARRGSVPYSLLELGLRTTPCVPRAVLFTTQGTYGEQVPLAVLHKPRHSPGKEVFP